jgi:hypothetical protein
VGHDEKLSNDTTAVRIGGSLDEGSTNGPSEAKRLAPNSRPRRRKGHRSLTDEQRRRLCDVIQSLRTKHGTWARLSEVTGVNAESLRGILKGTDFGSLSVAHYVARAAGVSVERILEGAARSDSERIFWAGVCAETDAEKRWERIAVFFMGDGSILCHWLALLELHDTWGKRDMKVRLGYVAGGKGRGRRGLLDLIAGESDIPKMGILFVAIRNDTGIPKTSAYRDIGYARTLLRRYGRDFVFDLLGKRLANDGHFLRDLVRLDDARMGQDAVEVYVRGAGEVKAKKALKEYLAVQAEREREATLIEEAESGTAPDSPTKPRAADSTGATDLPSSEAAFQSGGRVLNLPRDGTIVEGLRVLSVTDTDVVVEVHHPSATASDAVLAKPGAPPGPWLQ